MGTAHLAPSKGPRNTFRVPPGRGLSTASLRAALWGPRGLCPGPGPAPGTLRLKLPPPANGPGEDEKRPGSPGPAFSFALFPRHGGPRVRAWALWPEKAALQARAARSATKYRPSRFSSVRGIRTRGRDVARLPAPRGRSEGRRRRRAAVPHSGAYGPALETGRMTESPSDPRYRKQQLVCLLLRLRSWLGPPRKCHAGETETRGGGGGRRPFPCSPGRKTPL